MESDNSNTTPTQAKPGFWAHISGILAPYFIIRRSDLEDQEDIEQSVRSGVSFKGSQLLILIFAIFIASLGLNTDSVAVIIGAMLISPLMGPIIGMGLGIGVHDYPLMKRGLKNIVMAVLGSLAASAIFFLISPQYEGSSQLLARTSPSIYDVFIAFFGGAAGIVSIACKNKGQVMPGVAIATSLMPPLCTAGYGLATWQAHYFFGALYLFFTNMVFILFATWIGIKALKLKMAAPLDKSRAKRVQAIAYSVIGLTIAVSIYLTVVMIQKNIFLNKATNFVNTEMVFPNTQVFSHKEYIEQGKKYIDVTLIGQSLPMDSLELAMMKKLDEAGLGGTILNIKQGFSVSEKKIDTQQTFAQYYDLVQRDLASRQEMIDSLKAALDFRTGFSDEAPKIAPELKVLFPEVKDIALSTMIATPVDNVNVDTVNIAFVNAPGGLSRTAEQKLREYLEVRMHSGKVEVSVNPRSFPWSETNITPPAHDPTSGAHDHQ